MIKNSRWYLSPVAIFTYSLIAVASSFVLYIYWAVRAQNGIEEFLKKFNLSSDPLLEVNTWVIIVAFSVLLVIIILGLIIIYIYYYKSINLYRLQNNFINNFTHELKTPLTSLNLFLETFEKHELPRDEQLKYINYMKDDCDRLGTNVRHILRTARLESQTYQLDKELVELNSVIKEFIEGQNRLKRQAEIIFTPTTNPVEILLDKTLFEMLLLNLISNGIKYNHQQNKRVWVNIEKDTSGISIRVRDNGIGIPKKYQKDIFKKFFQIGDSLVMSAKGSGLGLFIVQTIVQLHKGKISVSSAGEGLGSIFKVHLRQYEG